MIHLAEIIRKAAAGEALQEEERTFLGSLRPATFNTEAKRHTNSLDVVAHYLKTVITHSRQVFQRLYQAIQSASADVSLYSGNYR